MAMCGNFLSWEAKAIIGSHDMGAFVVFLNHVLWSNSTAHGTIIHAEITEPFGVHFTHALCVYQLILAAKKISLA